MATDRSKRQFATAKNGAQVRYCGAISLHQQPETAKGFIFMSLEDEHSDVQVIIWKSVRDKQRDVMLQSKLLAVYGEWQRTDEACSLVAKRLRNMSALLEGLRTTSRDFH